MTFFPGFNRNLKQVWGDDRQITLTNQTILKNKPVLKKLLTRYYDEMISFLQPGGRTLELGSGGGFFKERYPQAIASDILQVSNLDIVMDGLAIPFKNGSINNIVLRGVLHHIHDPFAFFEECERILQDGGRIIINDPYISPFSFLINKYIHFEHCDYSWQLKRNKGQPLMDCNLALASIIFKKRIHDFTQTFPNLNIIHTNRHTYFIYLLTGGYSYPSLIPTCFFETAMIFEKLLSPFRNLLANILFIVLEKQSG
ncbi:MAG: class I SAM-dependent methyltransferase [bacterium]|nr:class I SAM-dependent methyltransferase [bacterium]